MAVEEKLGATKRFGSRYGKRNKELFIKVEKIQRQKKQCPYCNKIAVKRVAVGIWQCRKCNVKFTGKAYDISRKVVIHEKVTELKKGEEIPEKIEESETPAEEEESAEEESSEEEPDEEEETSEEEPEEEVK